MILESGSEYSQSDWQHNSTWQPETVEAPLRLPDTVTEAFTEVKRESVRDKSSIYFPNNDSNPRGKID